MKQTRQRHRAMVLVWDPAIKTNYWCDFDCGARTAAELIRQLRAGAKRGEWVSWRIITIEREEMGVCDE